MSEPAACDRARSCPDPSSRQSYCQRCDVLVDLDGFHVVEVAEHGDRVRVVIETRPDAADIPKSDG
jgi:transposase